MSNPIDQNEHPLIQRALASCGLAPEPAPIEPNRDHGSAAELFRLELGERVDLMLANVKLTASLVENFPNRPDLIVVVLDQLRDQIASAETSLDRFRNTTDCEGSA